MNNNSSMSNFMGEAYITYLIDRAGTLKLKAFTQTIDRFDENQGLQETGIGVYFKEDFDNLRDLRTGSGTVSRTSCARRGVRRGARPGRLRRRRRRPGRLRNAPPGNAREAVALRWRGGGLRGDRGRAGRSRGATAPTAPMALTNSGLIPTRFEKARRD